MPLLKEISFPSFNVFPTHVLDAKKINFYIFNLKNGCHVKRVKNESKVSVKISFLLILKKRWSPCIIL